MADHRPLVSIIIPAYNQAHYLPEAIDSALAQTYPNREIVVVDDGSTDETPRVAQAYGSKITYIHQQNKGLGGARNTGIRAAGGDLIAFLDSDDRWEPEFLATMVGITNNQPDIAVVTSTANCMDPMGNELPQVVGKKPASQEPLEQTLLRCNFIIPSTVLIRREAILEAGLFDEINQALHGCEDWDLWLRMAPRYSFVNLDQPLVRYRVHPQSLSANPQGMQEAVRCVFEKHFGMEDRNWHAWPAKKRRAFGGLYRYLTISTAQHNQPPEIWADHLQSALRMDPSLAQDLDLFYELAQGPQPMGYRGTGQHLDLETNAKTLLQGLQEAFAPSLSSGLRRQTYGTAYFALGLLAYNTGLLSLSRHWLWLALRYRPSLWREARVRSSVLKSYLGERGLAWLRQVRRSISPVGHP